MEEFDIYKDIRERTDGNVYFGVVGPVRAGKSTFIRSFMQKLVMPRMKDAPEKDRILDELPQSATGRTIMTTQPKFIPGEAVSVTLANGVDAGIRLVDCVGYMVDGAEGSTDGDKPRMVRTPWNDGEIPFSEAADIGTRKVISEHATIGIVVTTDGSISTELPRAAYVPAEERVVGELKELGKPFVIVLNSSVPDDPETKKNSRRYVGKIRRAGAAAQRAGNGRGRDSRAVRGGAYGVPAPPRGLRTVPLAARAAVGQFAHLFAARRAARKVRGHEPHARL